MAKPLSRQERRRQEKRARKAAKNPERVSVAEALGLAEQLYEKGELVQAADICKSVAKSAPKHFDAQQFHGILSAEMGRFETAIAAFETAAKIKPKDPSIHFNLANALDETGRWEDAEDEYGQALELKPRDPDTLVNLGIVKRKLGRLNDAIETFETAISLDDNSLLAQSNLGHAYLENSANEKAISCFRTAIALAPANLELHHTLTTALISVGDFGAAETACQKMLDLDPNNAKAHSQLGKVFQNLERPEESLEMFECAVALAPEDPGLLIELGVALRADGQISKAITKYEHALSLDADIGHAHYVLGNALSEYGKIAEAEQSYRKAVARLPEDPSTHNNLGITLIELGRKKEAEIALRTAIKFDPQHASSLFNLHAVVYQDDDLDPAIQALEAALEAKPGDAKWQFFHAMCLEQKGDDEAAMASFDKVPLDENGYNHWLDSWDYALRQIKQNASIRVFGTGPETYAHAQEAAELDGLILEFGVRFGTSIRQIAAKTDGAVHGFDSFQGLPEAWQNNPVGEYTTYGELPEVPDNVNLHVGLFEETIPPFMNENAGPIRFMNVDCDIYSSTKTILDLLQERIVPGTTIAFDEYFCNPSWRFDEFKAFQEAVEHYGWTYDYLSFCPFARQAVVKISG